MHAVKIPADFFQSEAGIADEKTGKPPRIGVFFSCELAPCRNHHEFFKNVPGFFGAAFHNDCKKLVVGLSERFARFEILGQPLIHPGRQVVKVRGKNIMGELVAQISQDFFLVFMPYKGNGKTVGRFKTGGGAVFVPGTVLA